MAYQIGRAKTVQETLDLVDANGKVVKKITVKLDADSIAADFARCYNEVIRKEKIVRDLPKAAEESPVQMSEIDAEKFNAAIEAFGSSILDLFGLIFGADQTQEILEFYDGKMMEMATQVVPFVVDVVTPAIKKANEQRMKQLGKNYKVSKAVQFGLNRQQRRNMGL